MEHQIGDLQLDYDGDLYLITVDEDGERDFDLIGFIEDCYGRVPDASEDAYHELLGVWHRWNQQDSGCLHAFEAAYFGSRGL